MSLSPGLLKLLFVDFILIYYFCVIGNWDQWNALRPRIELRLKVEASAGTRELALSY